MAAARPVSEKLSGAGEAETLGRVRVNIGHIAGGMSMNLISASARGSVDIRLPVGVSAATDRSTPGRDAGRDGGRQLARPATHRAKLHAA